MIGRQKVSIVFLVGVRVGVGAILGRLPRYQHILRFEASMALLESPNSNYHTSTYAQNAGQFPQRSDSTFRGSKVMYYSQREHRVEAIIAKRQLQIVAQRHLWAKEHNVITTNSVPREIRVKVAARRKLLSQLNYAKDEASSFSAIPVTDPPSNQLHSHLHSSNCASAAVQAA